MDDIKKILSDLKSMAAYAKKEAEDIKFGMDSINEILQQNLKLLVEISTSHAKVTNDINDRIDALEAQLRSTNTNKYEQVNTNEYEQVQMKEDPQCGSSSGPKRDAIMQSSKKVTINENHTRTVRIQPDEDDEIPLSSKEEEYKNFTKVIYEIKFNDSYFISPGEHIYPRVIMMKGAYPLMVKMSADYRFLDLIYPDRTLKEIERFDDILKSEISKYAQRGSIYLKFYTISPEVEDGIFLSSRTYHYHWTCWKKFHNGCWQE
ncbi:cytokinin dehydrogenase 3-like [Abeliophyllum distichum]|uniref:Cytokinin dehydrogenase 3-like n=1 Tax=Abeliophyllum distichum TaxID=126358 RepID=A0ABD1TYX3_9LAMI